MTCPAFNMFAKCCCADGTICLFCVRLTAVAIALILGALVAWKPRKTIEIQIALYRPFNWKLEPISMEKEIRNTRIMGIALLVVGAAAAFFLFR